MNYIVISLMVILSFGVILYVMINTFLGLGKYSPLFNGGSKTYFRGVGDVKCIGNRIRIIRAKNLNGILKRKFTVKAHENYKLNCNVTKEKGDILIKFSDGNNNLLGQSTETIENGIIYSCEKKSKITIEIEFEKFQGELLVEMVKL